MRFTSISIDCQNPADPRNITRIYNVVQCAIDQGTEEYNRCVARATELAGLVNAYAANNAEHSRLPQRLASDAIMGVLAEEGWLQYINLIFGEIAHYTNLEDVAGQIDLELTNGEKIEIRSSYIRNGVKFGICNDHYNFKNIGPYSNTIKPGEIQKHLYLAVLFETPKNALLAIPTIQFYLIGGSTWEMMENHGFNDPLAAVEDLIPVETDYRVVFLKDALDVPHVIEEIESKGYHRI